ncbi:MAG: Re/Si-specific NAD(P)(+) transhydrogenase subunit alpha [Gammaproteobacteria bacterium]|nr:Re/Si-specific NAD(P)(+) transhydrogenase subunit alpha [Gammaproteobacteria bacterium]
MKICVPRECFPGEHRVALTPETAGQIQKLGHTLVIESGAGENADFSDDAYREAGVAVQGDTRALWAEADVVLKVRAPGTHPDLGDEVELLEKDTLLISFIWPAQNEELMQRLSQRGVTVMAMDSVPRISRAQKLDALSSMANIAGYRAVVEAAGQFGRFFTGQVTAAGKVPPAKVMVIGAGVAGLAAIGAARGMGAIVRAFDTRPEVKEQVESMGAEFLELEFEEDGGGEGGYAKVMSKEFIEAEMALFREQAREVDIIITTALIPGKPAPELITTDMVESMKPGSVIVDLAAEQGGNCKLTQKDKIVEHNGVTLIGYTDLPSRLAAQSSQLYGTNLRHMLTDLTPEKDGSINVDMEDEVIRGATVIKDGSITWPPPAPKLSAAPPKPAAAKAQTPVAESLPTTAEKIRLTAILLAAGVLLLLWVGSVAPPDFMSHFTVFVLACFVGYQVIWSVSPSLHTPLMSVTNAISGIIVIGALLQISSPSGGVVFLAAIAILIASINIAGGFLVTQRMLKMFRK